MVHPARARADARSSPEAPSPGPATAEVEGRAWLGSRRKFLIDRRLQLRAGFLAVAVSLALLVLLNLSLHAYRTREADSLLADSPELTRVLRSQDRIEATLAAVASGIFLVGVFLVTILETHKTAGAAFNVRRCLGELTDGRYGTRLRLRRGDNLRELERPFNELCTRLQERAWRNAEQLDHLAADAERVATPFEAQALAERLRGLADGERGLADDV